MTKGAGFIQCIVMSVGRESDEVIRVEEPSLEDPFIQRLCAALGPRALSAKNLNDSINLPFELHALEAALKETCELLEKEVTGNIKAAKQNMDWYHYGVRGSRLTILYNLQSFPQVRNFRGGGI